MTAVFPTRFPVPATAIDGVETAMRSGGSKRKSAPTYGTPERQHTARESEALRGSEHRLVREVDDQVRRMKRDRGLDVSGERDAVVLPAAELLLAADQDGCDEVVRQLGERVADDGDVVLAVDDRDRLHVRAVTSSSIEPVNFAYSSVSSENETRRSCPWNGCRRQTLTRRSSISMRL